MTKDKDGIVQDERGQDQPADKKRAQKAEKTDQGLKPVDPNENKKPRHPEE